MEPVKRMNNKSPEIDYIFDHKWNKSRMLVYVFCIFLGVLYSVNNSVQLGCINCALIAYLVVTGDDNENFALLLGLQLLNSVILVSGLGFLFVAYPLAFYKIILDQNKLQIPIYVLLFLIYFFGVETFNFFFYNGKALGTVLLWALSVMYMFALLFKKGFKIKYNEAMNMFTLAFVGVVIINIIAGMVKTGGNYNWTSFNEYFRFGDEYRPLGGPNTIASIALFVVLTNALYCMFGKAKLQKFMSLLAIILGLIFGYLSISRAFLIGLTLIILLIFFMFSQGLVLKKFIFYCAILASIAGVILYFKNEFNLIFAAFANRFEQGNDDRVALIYKAFNAIMDNGKSIFFGKGVYYQLATNNTFTAHNLYMDVFVSFGVFGGFFYLSMFVLSFIRLKVLNKVNSSLAYYIPLIVVLSYNFIIGCVRDVGLYFYLIFAFHMACSRKCNPEMEVV